MTEWQNRIVGYGEERPDELLANPKNYRIHPAHQQAALSGVLSEVGVVQNVLVNRNTNTLIDGHLRVTLAMRSNQSSIPVTYVDLTDAEEALILATFDPISALAATDAAQLDALLREVSTSDAAVMQMLADLAEEAGVVSFDGENDGMTDADEVPEPPVDPITRPGDLWTLGRHRLLCGDSTNRADVDRLMGGAKADMVFTDPPYGVPVLTDFGLGKRGKVQVDGKTFAPVIGNEQEYDPSPLFLFGCPVLTWGANHYAHRLPHNGKWLIWDKREDKIPTRTQADCEIAWFSEYGAARIFRHYWDGMLKASERGESRVHPTQKPIALATWCFDETDAGRAIVDPYLGSGTTVIACEQSERSCYGMEISPIYCDVIVRRWEAFTGETASREAAD